MHRKLSRQWKSYACFFFTAEEEDETGDELMEARARSKKDVVVGYGGIPSGTAVSSGPRNKRKRPGGGSGGGEAAPFSPPKTSQAEDGEDEDKDEPGDSRRLEDDCPGLSLQKSLKKSRLPQTKVRVAVTDVFFPSETQN